MNAGILTSAGQAIGGISALPAYPATVRAAMWEFDPQLVPGMFAWYDSSDSSTYDESSGQVVAWRSKVGGTVNTLTQPTAASRPTLFTSSGDVQSSTRATVGGKQAFYFDGVNDRMEPASFIRPFPFVAGGEFSIIAVAARATGDTSGNRCICQYGSYSPIPTASVGILDSYVSGQQRIAIASGYSAAVAPRGGHAGAAIYRVQRRDGEPISMFVNGTLMATDRTVGSSIANDGTTVVRVGYFNINNSANNFFQGSICEIMLLAEIVQSPLIDRLEQHLRNKWAIA